MMIYLYKITNSLNNKVYIGQSADKNRRWRQHKYFSKNPERTGQYIHRAINKYGVENFIYEIIATCKTTEDADVIETEIIKQYNSRNKEYGYNVAPGGDSPWNRGLPKEQQPMYGKTQSEYFKKRMSEVHKGKTFVQKEETKKKISISLTGKNHTEITKNKISIAHCGKILSEATKNKMSIAKLGTHHNEETKSKIGISNSISLFGIKQSNEHKKNNSISHIGIHSGEKHPQAKLTNEQVLEIREKYKYGATTYKQLGITYNVGKHVIAKIIRNETYTQ